MIIFESFYSNGILVFQAFFIIKGAFLSKKNRTTQIEQQVIIIPQMKKIFFVSVIPYSGFWNK